MKVFVIGGVTVDADADADADELSRIETIGLAIGKSMTEAGHDIVLCSPFPDSLDYFVLRGAADTEKPAKVDAHFPRLHTVDDEFEKVEAELAIEVTRFRHEEVSNSASYSWLLSQLAALDSSAVVIAAGGKENGSASLLFALARVRNKRVLPLAWAAGAAAQFYDKEEWDLRDLVGDGIQVLTDPGRVAEIPELLIKLAASEPERDDQRFFISYPRARPAEADHVETVLRRRNCVVFRDEEDFEAGQNTQTDILRNVERSNVFVAIWCSEYACSPWCIDEMEEALAQREGRGLLLWILKVDDTRIVPRKARDLTYFDVRSREELEGQVLKLLERLSEDS